MFRKGQIKNKKGKTRMAKKNHQFLQKASLNSLCCFGDCSTGYGYGFTASAWQSRITLCKPQNLNTWGKFLQPFALLLIKVACISSG